MARAAIGGSIGESHTDRATRIVSGKPLFFRAHEEFRVAVVFRETEAAFRQPVTDRALAEGLRFEQLDHGVGIAEFQRKTDVALGDIAFLSQLNRRTNRDAGFEGI